MNVVMGPFYKGYGFWSAVIVAIAGVLGGIFGPESIEVVSFASAAGAILTWLAARGYVTGKVAESASRTPVMGASAQDNTKVVNF